MAPPLHGYRSVQTAVKAKKLKKATVTKQQQMEIPPALTALLQTVKQVRGPAFYAFDLFFAVVARFFLSPHHCSMPCAPCPLSLVAPPSTSHIFASCQIPRTRQPKTAGGQPVAGAADDGGGDILVPH